MKGKERLSKAKVTFAHEDITLNREGSSQGDSSGEESVTPSRIIRSPPPEPRPSPTSSGSSSDSTGGPLTPPNLQHHTLLPDPKAPTGTAPPVLNDGYGGGGGGGVGGARKPKLAPVLVAGRQLQWDMAKCPTTLKHVLLNAGSDRAGCLPNGEPITSMEVIFDEALSDWPLHINAPGKCETLTVYQVWTAIHEHLGKFVSKEHFEKLKALPDVKERVRGAFAARTQEVMFKGDGIRRIDYMPSRKYAGLSVKAGKHGWEYHLACGDQ